MVTLHLCLKAMAKLSNRVMEKMIKYRFLISLPPSTQIVICHQERPGLR